jgi:hypothetical protein
VGFCGAAEVFFSVLSVAEKRLNTEVTEALRVFCVEALEAQRTQSSWFSCGHHGALYYLAHLAVE